MDASLSELMSHLLSSSGNSLSGWILGSLQIIADKHVPSMGVTVQNRHYVLMYNPEWFKKAEYNEVVAVVEHEAMHVLLEHIPRSYLELAMCSTDEEKRTFKMCNNIAADMADNCLVIKGNPWVQAHKDGWVFPEHEPFKFAPDLAYETYMELLRDYLRKNPPPKIKMCILQAGLSKNHEKWFEGAGGKPGEGPNGKSDGNSGVEGLTVEEALAIAQDLKTEGKKVIAQAIHDYSKSRGTVPAHLQELIDELLREPIMPWLQILRNLVINTRRFKIVRSIRRPNRRHFGIPKIAKFPGKAKDMTFTVTFLVDTSGSMGTEELQQALSELQAIQKADSDILIHIVESDANVGKEYTITAKDKVDPEFTGRGGTDFNPALLRAQKIESDIVFYYTDGYAPAPEPESRVSVPFVWLITPNGQIPDQEWGRVLRMKDMVGGNNGD